MKIKFSHIALFWTVFAFFMTGVMMLVHPASNRPVSILGEFVWEVGFTFPWILCTPLVLLLSKKFPVEKKHLIVNGVILFLFGLLISVLTCLAHGMILYLFHPDVDVFEVNIFYRSLFYNIDKMLVIYCALVLMQHAMTFYEQFRQKELTASKLENQLTNAQMQALKMQLQPHFLFNTLNAIVTLIHKDPNLAEEMTVRLSDFLRMTLDASGKQMVTLREELDFIKAYLQIEEVRFGGAFSYSENISPEVLDAQLPVLLLQPLVENAIKHGISRYAHAQSLNIAAEKKGDRLIIIVADDGAPVEQFNIVKEGIGLSNTRGRLTARYGERALLQLTANEGGGARVEIRLPLVTEENEN